MLILKIVLIGIALIVVVGTGLPLLKFDHWSVRMFDFPRLQLAILGLLTLGLWLLFSRASHWLEVTLMLALVVAVVYQGYRIFPYTRLASHQVKTVEDAERDGIVSLLIANVLMSNRNSEGLLNIIRHAGPDIVLALEPDGWWEKQFRALERDFPYTVKKPLDNRYGMLLYSRYELIDPEIKFLLKDDIPSIHTLVKLPSGQLIRLHCIHPEPPSPTEAETSTHRDAELLIVGREVKDHRRPVIVTGDLNDVAWSDTTTLFQKTSGLLDPRVGRGMFNTFNAKNPLARWPLDHVFHSDDFLLLDIARLPAFGSDHFPIFIKLSYQPQAEHMQDEPEKLDGDEKQEVKEKIDEVDQQEAL